MCVDTKKKKERSILIVSWPKSKSNPDSLTLTFNKQEGKIFKCTTSFPCTSQEQIAGVYFAWHLKKKRIDCYTWQPPLTRYMHEAQGNIPGNGRHSSLARVQNDHSRKSPKLLDYYENLGAFVFSDWLSASCLTNSQSLIVYLVASLMIPVGPYYIRKLKT